MNAPTDVIWITKHPGIAQRGYWDQGLLEHIFNRELWRPARPREFTHRVGFDQLPAHSSGCVLVIPGRWHTDDVVEIREQLDRLDWALVIVTGDEEGEFDWRALQGDRRIIWVQTPHPAKGTPDRRLGDYWPPDAPRIIRQQEIGERVWRVFFAGQINNERREQALAAMQAWTNGAGALLYPTDTFGGGLDYEAYLGHLARTKVAPCPPGCFTPDTFRLFEALEAGAVPIADAIAPNTGDEGYWQFLFGEQPPFPIITDWAEDFARTADEILADWVWWANRCRAWWLWQRRSIGWWLDDDLDTLGVPRPDPTDANDLITVLIPTSPIPAHPSTAVIDETIGSIRERLPTAAIYLLIDGIRPEQADRRDAYEAYQQRLLRACTRWQNVAPIRFDAWLHQAAMTAHGLAQVRTPHVLFVEHDTPLIGDIPFDRMCDALSTRDLGVQVIRLHHEASVLPEHEHLMLDRRTRRVRPGLPMRRTIQWSQRPHLANTDWYRLNLREFFGPDARTMIEDVLHGVLEVRYREWGQLGWEHFGLWLYTPAGDMKRSTHLDGRGDDPKYGMIWAYDGPTPFGAPTPTDQRDEVAS